jgi:DNA-binding CsgD family transcriptional regulator
LTAARKSDIKSHMTAMMGKDYRQILETVYTMNSCEDEKSFLDVLIPSMSHMFHADCITFHLIRGYPYHLEVAESRSFKPTEHNLNEDKVYPGLYQDSFFQRSPLLKEALSSSKAVLKLGESISLKDWERSDLYNNFILPQNLYWEMFLTLRWKSNLEGMVTLWRSKGRGDYAGNEVMKAELLAPHLMLAARNVFSVEKVNRHKSNFLKPEDSNTEGLLLLDHNLKPLYFNAKARQICLQLNNQCQSSDNNRQEREFYIPTYITQDCRNLLELQKRDDQPVLWPRERIVITQNNQKFRIECSLIWKAQISNFQPNFLVIMNEIKAGQNPAVCQPARHELSKRELDIIYYLNQGLSYGEIGEKLFISKFTVHTHIKNIYRKLGAKNRTELYRFVQPPSWLK